MMNNLAQIAQLVRGRDPQSIVLDMVKNQKINDTFDPSNRYVWCIYKVKGAE